MARFSAAFRTTGAGSTTLPIASLYGTTGVRAVIKEIAVFNTTATAVTLAIRRATTAGTQGTGQAELPMSDTAQAALATTHDTHTGAPTLTAGNIRAWTLGAAVGSGVVWTFERLTVANVVAEGIVIVPLTGTGQICDVSFEWEE